MNSGVIKVGLVALIGTMIIVGVYGCKKSEDYYNRGVARLEKGETDRAISDFTKAIKMNPRFGMAYYYRAMAYSRKKEYDQVIADYTRAIEIDPQRFAVAYAERALIYYVKKEYDKAWEDVHKAESLGQEVRPEFLKTLRKDSGRKKWIKSQPGTWKGRCEGRRADRKGSRSHDGYIQKRGRRDGQGWHRLPGNCQEAQGGLRIFDIKLQNKVVAESFDILETAGKANRANVKELKGIRAESVLVLELLPKSANPQIKQDPIINFIEVVREDAGEIVQIPKKSIW